MADLKLPDFPANSLGLKRGSILRSVDAKTEELGLKVGDCIPIGYDGKYIRCDSFTWSLEQLAKEITEWRIWVIDGELDLSSPPYSLRFAREIERLLPD